MKLLIDTHLLLWIAATPDRVSEDARALISDRSNHALFSVVSLWETSIKYGLRKQGFGFEPRRLRQGLLSAGFGELNITGEHAIAVATLPHLHGDPFDRLLLAQADVEGAVLVTSDAALARYPGPIRLVEK